jgi:hypothetical protein
MKLWGRAPTGGSLGESAHEVFPILSNPSVLKRPFNAYDNWKH